MSSHPPLLTLAVIAALAGSCNRESASGPRPDQSPTPVQVVDAAAPVRGSSPPPFEPSAFAVAAPVVAEARQILRRQAIADTEPSLHITSSAPKLYVQGWLKGRAVVPVRGKVYVIENWATWCKPCIDAMPHLSELAERHAGNDVVVAAINVEDSEIADVRTFVAKHSRHLRYSVGYDRSGNMDRHWIKAAGLRGLPASFVIDRSGHIAWIGHPKDLAGVVDKIAHKRWRANTARSEARRQRLAVPYSQRVVSLLETKPKQGYELARALMATVLRDKSEFLVGLAYHILAAPAVATRDLEVAYTAAALAAAHVQWTDPATLEVLSRIREAQRRTDEAIALQRRAVDVAKNKARYTPRWQRLVGQN